MSDENIAAGEIEAFGEGFQQGINLAFAAVSAKLDENTFRGQLPSEWDNKQKDEITGKYLKLLESVSR